MADLLAEVPQHIKDVFGDLLAPGGLLVGQDEQQIDVRARRQRGAAIAADRGQRHRFGLGRVGVRIDILGGEQMDGADDLVFGLAQIAGAAPARAACASSSASALARACGQRLPWPCQQQRRAPWRELGASSPSSSSTAAMMSLAAHKLNAAFGWAAP